MYVYQLILITLTTTFTDCEYFTSSGHLRYLFDMEKKFTGKLRQLINTEERRIARLKKFYNHVQHLEEIDDHERYIGQPTNVFKVIRRLHKDWPKLNKITNPIDPDFVPHFQQYVDVLPTKDDLRGAKAALLRLQDTFALSANQISTGIVPHSLEYTQLSAADTFDIGRMAYFEGRHDVTVGWMSESLRLLNLNTDNISVEPTKAEVLDHLAWAEYQTNMIPSAYNHTLELIKIEPDNVRIRNNKDLFEEMISEGYDEEITPAMNQLRPDEFPHFYYTADEDETDRFFTEKKLWQKLCRGETKPIPKIFTKDLVCWQKSDHPMLVLKPARLERIYPNPELIFFRQAVSDREIEIIKNLAVNMLQRATVNNPATGKLEFADYRTSKSAWLDESHGEIVEIMDRRIEAYTGLSMETAEKLQVANYGMGGHYETHFDFGRSVPLRPPPHKNRTDYTRRFHKEAQFKYNGHRIATWLTYMSDVEAGGATVFTNIGQAVYPSKGDAVFWYNLHHDGSGDVDTRHAACPVLIGEKWVSNRWIHEWGQEFRRPCKLKPEDD